MLEPSHPLAELLQEDRRFTFEAYVFVFEALGYAQNVLDFGTEYPAEAPASEEEGPPDEEPAHEEPAHKEPADKEPADKEPAVEKHVTGQELCEAIRQFALQQFGYMAKTVLNNWGITRTGDFGEIVFNLIRIGQMRKTPHDCREDFDDVYEFDAAFEQDFKITMPE